MATLSYNGIVVDSNFNTNEKPVSVITTLSFYAVGTVPDIFLGIIVNNVQGGGRPEIRGSNL